MRIEKVTLTLSAEELNKLLVGDFTVSKRIPMLGEIHSIDITLCPDREIIRKRRRELEHRVHSSSQQEAT